ncbi:Major facilitator superfamily domain, general substrate transporter [Metarhizium album ARSEF 1941]|uniref:Major facilitator superfamily domain, general substrate transporter n=1 Tax=Metarhizium album (strain ARSEF 1941) TaxID=1081103 RepID=A0A0B2WQK3_METAS|nr:Major facilitator superfamily domain, general substrate transporter [Metarhizium album ARSEF 1941]KHN95240.1 Major facilitator superfamily domain, general substrate transporter [Metarhizium album ARSEF 1941]
MDGPGDSNDDHARAARRFATLGGWREAQDVLPSAAGSTYDSEWPVHDEKPHPSRQAKAQLKPADGFGTGEKTGPGQDGLGPDEQPDSTATRDERAVQEDELEVLSELGSHLLNDDDAPFGVLSSRQKWFIIVTIGVAGLCSGLSPNVYLPALSAIAKDLKVSLGDVSSTTTSYLVVQSISPLLWGCLSDTLGRRPIYIYSLSINIVANIVLSLSPNYPVLLVFRGVQAAGSASTTSIGSGVIQDIASPGERGAFLGSYQAIRNFSIAVGPVIGGLLTDFLGYRSVFVFLLIVSVFVLATIVTLLPETLRIISGNGSLWLSGIHQPLIRRLVQNKGETEEPGHGGPTPKVTVATFLKPLALVGEKDVLISLVLGGTVYTVWSMVVASTTGLFRDLFHLNDLLLGLALLPNGFGAIVGSAAAGKLMTRDFARCERIYLEANPSAASPSRNDKDLPPNFPIEHVRLRHVPWISALFTTATALYGLTVLPAAQLSIVARPGWITAPLVLQFLIAATSNAIFATNATLVADLCPDLGAGATAIGNLVHCAMGALGIALVDSMPGALGGAAMFLGLGLLTVGVGALVYVELMWGMQWRNQRLRRTRSEP